MRKNKKATFIFIGLIVLIVIGGGLFLAASQTQAASAQPIAFTHVVMVQAGIPCLYYHSDATKSPVAGMPSVQK